MKTKFLKWLGQWSGKYRGKRTYILAGVGAVTALGALLTGDLSPADFVRDLWACVVACTMRAGIAGKAKAEAQSRRDPETGTEIRKPLPADE